MSDIADKLAELGIEPLDGGTFQPLSQGQIAELRRTVNAQLPEEYERFLATYGRSAFSRLVNCASAAKPIYFGWFFGFDELLLAIECCKQDLPETIIPIGEDGLGNSICLGVAGKDFGKVYFNHHSIGWRADAEALLRQGKQVPSDIRYRIVHEVAPSFEQFIKNMFNEE
jgi:SMI1/KNR4 family protein SUKH-1